MLLGLHFVDLALHSQAQGATSDIKLPLALVGGQPMRVLQCNQAALQAGVAIGQSIATATALCESLQLLQQQARLQQQALQTLAAWAYGFSAQVMLIEPDTLVLEVKSMLRLFGGLEAWLEQLQQELQQRGLPWQQALAHTPLAATLLARNGINHRQAEQTGVMAALAPLTLQQCQRPEAARLASMGINTLAQLLSLPRHELGRRFGLELLLWLQQLQGQRPDPRPWFSPPQSYQRHLVLLHEISQVAVLRFPLKRLFVELADQLRRRQLALPQVTLRLIHRERPATELTLRGAGDEHRAEAWQKLAELQLERLTLYEPIIEIELIGAKLQPLSIRNETLISGTELDGQAQDLLAQLQARLGRDRVRAIQALAEHRPEYASNVVAAGKGQDLRDKNQPAPQRPMWLLSQPQATAREQFRLIRGPERIETGWWQQDPIGRDYFIAQHHTGALAWLYCDSQGWFVHGWF